MTKALLRATLLIVQLNILLIGGLGLMILVTGHWPGPISPIFDLNFVLAPWVVLALLPATGLAWALRRRYARWYTLFLLLVLGLPYGQYFLPRFGLTGQLGFHLKIMSFNTWGKKRAGDAEQIAQVISAEQPDVAVLQEVTAARLVQLMASLKAINPTASLNVIRYDVTDQVIISRFPLTQIGTDSEATQLLQAQVRTPAGDMQIWNVHAYRQNYFAAFSERNILSYSNLADHRDGMQQFAWLKQRAAAVKEPLILAGDFNVTPFSAEYELITQPLSDAYAEAGYGFGFTFPATRAQTLTANLRGQRWRFSSPGPLAQIDHIFHNGRFSVRSSYVLTQSAGSDHRPMVAEVMMMG